MAIQTIDITGFTIEYDGDDETVCIERRSGYSADRIHLSLNTVPILIASLQSIVNQLATVANEAEANDNAEL